MLIKHAILQGIASGSIDLAFRRWNRARVKPGSRLKTAVGVLEVVDVATVTMKSITEREARRAGHASRAELLDALRSREGRVHRVRLRHVGEDPRIALRTKSRLSATELEEIRRRLARFDAASRHGAWTKRVLRLIAEQPGVRAQALADSLGREKLPFKGDVRKLKELGLTESLKTGYRLSPRGKAVLRHVEK